MCASYPPTVLLSPALLNIFAFPHCFGGMPGKSTYARCGIIVNVTPLEPEGGTCNPRVFNTTPLPAKIYANEGVCQFLFSGENH